jgi:hypothetical protein
MTWSSFIEPQRYGCLTMAEGRLSQFNSIGKFYEFGFSSSSSRQTLGGFRLAADLPRLVNVYCDGATDDYTHE